MQQAAPTCQYHSTNAPHSFIHLSPTLHNLSTWERRLTTRRDTKCTAALCLLGGSAGSRHTCAFAVSQHQKAHGAFRVTDNRWRYGTNMRHHLNTSDYLARVKWAARGWR
jgi:hypothetical protein